MTVLYHCHKDLLLLAAEKVFLTIASHFNSAAKVLPQTPELLTWKANFDINKCSDTLVDVPADKYGKHKLAFRYSDNNNVYKAVTPNVYSPTFVIGTI